MTTRNATPNFKELVAQWHHTLDLNYALQPSEITALEDLLEQTWHAARLVLLQEQRGIDKKAEDLEGNWRKVFDQGVP